MDDLTIVTGGAGFIGSHLVDRLVGEGHRVRVVERPGADVAHLPASVEVAFADIRDRAAVDRAVAGGRWVYHLAANPNLWARDRREFDEVNHRGTVHVLDAALSAGADRVLHCSTESILTRAGSVGPIAEDVEVTDRDAVGPYCLSKLRAERAAMDRARAGAPVVIANPTMPVGPGDRGPSPPTRLMLDFCNGRLPAVMDCSLNLIDVRDVADGLIQAMRIGDPGRRYLLGGANLTLLELLAILGDFCGLRPPRLRVPYGVALASAYVSEFWADHFGGGPPQATLSGVRLTRRSMHFDASRSLEASACRRVRFAGRWPKRWNGMPIGGRSAARGRGRHATCSPFHQNPLDERPRRCRINWRLLPGRSPTPSPQNVRPSGAGKRISRWIRLEGPARMRNDDFLVADGQSSRAVEYADDRPGGRGLCPMPIRLVALDEGPDITIDRAMLIVGRHPQCDARLDSIRVSRRHCCMMQDKENVVVRDLGSTNGIRINGQRVEEGKLRPGDELSIAHIRFRMEAGHAEELTLAETMPADHVSPSSRIAASGLQPSPVPVSSAENPLAAAVRDLLPAAMADRCRIQVIVQMPSDESDVAADPDAEAQTPESDKPCPPDSSPSIRD